MNWQLILITLIKVIHLTEFGYCVHNYLIKPCAKINHLIECDNETPDINSVDRIRLQSVREKVMQLKRITQIAYEMVIMVQTNGCNTTKIWKELINYWIIETGDAYGKTFKQEWNKGN